MKVERYKFIITNSVFKTCTPVFMNSADMRLLKNANIGNAPDNFIGKIIVRDGKNSECLLNVIKKILGDGYENYTVKNNDGVIIGEATLKIRKFTNYDIWQYSSNPSHVFIFDLKNYSNPSTPYYTNIEQFKDIGIRLMQIALKRSYEAGCDGNLKLISKNESKDWYKNVIGMTEEFPETKTNKYRFSIHNPNALILPQSAKESLSTLHGGL